MFPTGPGSHPRGSRPARTAPSGSRTRRPTRSGGSPPRASSPIHERAAEGPAGITAGPDGALWFTNAAASSIGRITTSGVVSIFPGVPGTSPVDIAAGPDGALWFTTFGNTVANAVGRITTAGAVTSFTDPALSVGYPQGISMGPDGALWLVDEWLLFRVTTGGEITSFDVGSTRPSGITLGPDGALWFTGRASNVIGRAVLPPTAAPSGLSATALSRSQIGLSWTDNASNEAGFRIERSPNGSSDWRQVATVGANVIDGRSGSKALFRFAASNGCDPSCS